MRSRNLDEQQEEFMDERCLRVVADSSLLHSLQCWNLKNTQGFVFSSPTPTLAQVKNLCSVHFTNR